MFAPDAVAASFQILAHKYLYLIQTKPIQGADLIEADMVARRHHNDFADLSGIKSEFCDLRVSATAAR
jgi:hypothetical protein